MLREHASLKISPLYSFGDVLIKAPERRDILTVQAIRFAFVKVFRVLISYPSVNEYDGSKTCRGVLCTISRPLLQHLPKWQGTPVRSPDAYVCATAACKGSEDHFNGVVCGSMS